MQRITRQDITGLVLCGGRSTRMGGLDKGLQPYRGQPLVQHAITRLEGQVGAVVINANRHPERYATFGLPVWPDPLADHPGPLAGWLAGLERCATPWLLSVPCDSPQLPLDLAARLAAALDGSAAQLAVAATTEQGLAHPRPQPVFCLLAAALAPRLRQSLLAGERKVMAWVAQQPYVTVVFEDARAFANANTPAELAALGADPGTSTAQAPLR